jgi:hypothetical protein
MIRRFELGPILVAVGAVLLLVSLFLDWYGPLSAWAAFEVVDVMLAGLAVAGLLAGLGTLLPELAVVERRWLPGLVLAVAVLVAAEIIDPPPAAADLIAGTGAWIGFGAAIVMLIGAVLSLGRVSLSVSVEARDTRQRVAAVDERQQTTETGAVVVPTSGAAAPGGSGAPGRAPGPRDTLLPRDAPAGEAPVDPATAPTVADTGSRARRRTKG